MGRCQEFGTPISESCEHPMDVRGPTSCGCEACGVECRGHFNGCAQVWAAGAAALPSEIEKASESAGTNGAQTDDVASSLSVVEPPLAVAEAPEGGAEIPQAVAEMPDVVAERPPAAAEAVALTDDHLGPEPLPGPAEGSPPPPLDSLPTVDALRQIQQRLATLEAFVSHLVPPMPSPGVVEEPDAPTAPRDAVQVEAGANGSSHES